MLHQKHSWQSYYCAVLRMPTLLCSPHAVRGPLAAGRCTAVLLVAGAAAYCSLSNRFIFCIHLHLLLLLFFYL
jgi:hypothetical protein